MDVSYGNGVVPPTSERMQVAVGGVGNGESAAVQRQPPWFVDERDSYIAWLRSEFAAANAIVDLLSHHLRAQGEPGEYDQVAACISQRRAQWMPVLHMQQFFPIGEVAFALQQVAWRKQQHQQHQATQHHRHFDALPRDRDGRKPGIWHRNRFEGVHTNHGSSMVSAPVERMLGIAEKVEDNVVQENSKQSGDAEMTGEVKHGICNDVQPEDNCSQKEGETLTKSASCHLEVVSIDGNHYQDSQGNSEVSMPNICGTSTSDQDGKQKSIKMPRDFIAKEMHNGKMVNVVEGLKLYENLVDNKEISRLISYASERRNAGRKGELLGSTYVMWKRPMKGHGREFVQLGIPIVRGLGEEENIAHSSREKKVEEISHSLHEIFNMMLELQILPSKPDFCVIDFFNEDDHSRPQIWPYSYGRPVCNLFLTECDIVYGREIGADHHGSYSGSLKLSITAGSLLIIDGNSAVLARRAIPSLYKQRIILTFGKSRTRNDYSEGQSFPPSNVSPPISWGSQSARSSNINRDSPGPKHYGFIPTAAVLTTPVHPQSIPANGIQPRQVAPPPVSPATVPLPPAPSGWTTAVPVWHPVPRLPIPGTGVFLPPGSSPSSASQLTEVSSDSAETNLATEMASPEIRGNGVEKANSNGSVSPNTSPIDRKDITGPKHNPIENLNGTSNGNSCGDTSVGNEHCHDTAAKLSIKLTSTSIK